MPLRTLLALLGIVFLIAGCGTEAGDDDSAPVADDDDDDITADDDDDSSEVTDDDGDGWSVEDGDCDDTDPAVHPEAEEVACDGIDNDCDGSQHEYDIDDDGDGVTECDGDGDDADPDTYPGADEIPCNGIDNDCDGSLHDWDMDDDSDGVTECDGDCDDADHTIYPGAEEIPCSGIDNDCDGNLHGDEIDDDGDGFDECGGDCDDGDAGVNPDAAEACNTVDDNCDGDIDEGFDLDLDSQTTCGGDCDDGDPDAYTGAPELCDGLVNDCAGQLPADEEDLDVDGFMGCEGDCDDNDDQINPDALEICDLVDNNCDGNADENVSPLGGGYDCPALSCYDVLQDQPAATDDTYWIGDPGPADAIEVYCDMTGGGWTLVYRATNSGIIENVDATTPDAYGSTPITPWITGEHKLHDDVVNDMRSGAVLNDLSVVIYYEGSLLGQSWHPNTCALQTGTTLPAADVCNMSTTTGPDATDYIQSGHQGALTRWYVDADFGFIWTNTHIGPVAGGQPHYGNLPEPYCTWYDHRTCPGASEFEIWVQ